MSIISPENPNYAKNAAAAATGIPVFAGIVAGSGLAGMAHEGIANIPDDGTWLLKKNERVVGAELNRDLTTYLSNQTSNVTNNNSKGGHSFYFNVSSDAENMKKVSPQIMKQIENTFARSPKIARQTGRR